MLGNTCLGLGNPEQCLLDNQWTDNKELNSSIKEMLSEAINIWFTKYGGVDFDIVTSENGVSIIFGIEPTYMYDPLIVYCIDTDKDKSYRLRGVAWGLYGSQIAKTIKYYSDYKNLCQFTRFVDKWSNILNENLKEAANEN